MATEKKLFHSYDLCILFTLPTFACSKSAMESPEESVKHAQS